MLGQVKNSQLSNGSLPTSEPSGHIFASIVQAAGSPSLVIISDINSITTPIISADSKLPI